MESLGLLLGHLIGDYILQDDWMAKNKTSSTLVCLVHCVLYTFGCFSCAFWWLPLWAYPVIFVFHFPVDRWRLARRWMSIMGQETFATGVFAPWSIIVVDNTIHLAVLFVVGVAGC